MDRIRWLRAVAMYVVVGVGNVATYLGTLAALHEMLGINVYISATIGFAAAVGVSFVLNRNLTFPGRASIAQVLRYFAILFVIMLLNHLILYITITHLRWHYMIGQLIAIAVLTPTNFAISYLLVFRPMPGDRGKGNRVHLAR